jgi:hypothetical protein
MRIALALVAAAGAGACTTGQVRTTHRAGEIMAGAGLIGIMGAVATAELVPDEHSTILRTGIVFVPVAVVGALLYAATDSTVNRPEAPDVSADRNADLAMDLAKQAKHAARRGDCAEVLALEPRVRELDAGIYRRFRRDKVIGTCLPPAAAEPEAVPPSVPPAAPPSVPPAAPPTPASSDE